VVVFVDPERDFRLLGSLDRRRHAGGSLSGKEAANNRLFSVFLQ
jgi:hypothetical protein